MQLDEPTLATSKLLESKDAHLSLIALYQYEKNLKDIK